MPDQALPYPPRGCRVVGGALAALVLACLSGCSQSSEGGEGDRAPRWSPDGKQIAFVSDRDGDDQLYVAGANGGQPRRLTRRSILDFVPEWSPDGKSLAFISAGDDGKWEIHVTPAHGGGARRLTRSRVDDFDPRWSPDGSRIVFVRAGSELSSSELYSVTPAGKVTRLTRNRVGDTAPAWSPDGKRIAFARGELIKEQIFVLDVSSGELTQVSKGDVAAGAPAWSPDGQKLAFDDITDLVVVDADGSRQTRFPSLVARELIVTQPTWSPDGRRILFTEGPHDTLSRDNSRYRELYVVNADGSGVRRLTRNQVWDGGAEWSPDGRRIVFESGRAGGRSGIYVMNARGTNVRRLAEPP